MVAKNTNPAIQVRLSRQLGNDRIEFEVQILSEPGSELYEINRVNDLLKSAMVDFMNNVAVQLPPAITSGGYKDIVSDAWYDVEHVFVSIEKGKRYIKLQCGKWLEYGVVCFPEVLTKAGIPHDKIPDAGFKPTTWKARIIEREKYPPRVLEITHGNVSVSNE